ARSKAQSAYEEMRNAGVDAHKEMLESAYAESAKISSAAGAELDAAVRDARASLSKDIEKFSTQIMNKLVGA
ncbi:hypothetical protein H8E50_09525, partial [bacterium]|nr:hypothetical protein [bacterium]